MSIRNINEIITTNTFGQWIERTNEVIQSLDQVVTMGTDDIANNDGPLYVQGNITTEGSLVSDVILPLDNAADLVDIQAGLTRTRLMEVLVPEEGQNNALQFTYNPTLASADTWRMGPGTNHDTFEIASRNTISDVSIFDSIISISRATEPLSGVDPEPGVISGTNIVIDDAILPAELAFSNANSASRWATPRTITFDSLGEPGEVDADVIGSVTFDGSADVTVNLQVVNDSHLHDTRYYTKTSIDGKFTNFEATNDVFVKVSPTNKADRSIVQGTGFAMADSAPLTFGTGDDATVQWDGNNFEIRQSSGTGYLTAASAYIFNQFQGSGVDTARVKIDLNSGAIIASGDVTAFGDASDINLKENIKPIENALDKVCTLRGVTFNYIHNPDERLPGLIAQDLLKVLPEAVYTTPPTPGTEDASLAVRYGQTVALLVEAIKELKAELDALKARG